MTQTITAADIMAGRLPKTCREFTVPDVGKIKLFRLPADMSAIAKKQTAPQKRTPKQLEEYENLILKSLYYMLHGEYDEKLHQEKAKGLLNVMEEQQISSIFTTGLFYQNLSPENKSKIEKN